MFIIEALPPALECYQISFSYNTILTSVILLNEHFEIGVLQHLKLTPHRNQLKQKNGRNENHQPQAFQSIHHCGSLSVRPTDEQRCSESQAFYVDSQ